MKKTIKLIDLDCGHCADKIQTAVKKLDGVTSVSVNFLVQKMVLEAPDDKFDAVLAEAKALIKKIEPDLTLSLIHIYNPLRRSSYRRQAGSPG